MAFTDHSDLFGSVHEDGINLVVRHLMQQRPSLFNYATPTFHQRPDLFCERIVAAEKVLQASNPLFTELEPLPVLGTPVPIGLNFCVQLTHAQIDFHPGNAIELPPELSPLGEQRFALRARGCGGIDCPRREIIDELVPAIEAILVREQDLLVGETDERPGPAGHSGPAGASSTGAVPAGRRTHAVAASNVSVAVPQDIPTAIRNPDVIVLPTRQLICFCLEIFAVGHFEWGDVIGSQQRWLKARLDGLEIVDLTPAPMEEALECYISTVVRLGILPRLIVPTEKMVLDITAEVKRLGLELGKQVNLEPAAVPADVPNNPAVEEDQLKVFVNLEIT